MTYHYETLETKYDQGILTATINNPPANVMTIGMYADLVDFTKEVAADDNVRVVVFESADPDFFIAHFDIEVLLASPAEGEVTRPLELNDFHLMCERVRTMPKATIVKMAGRTGGGGNEFASSCDMRFGVRGKTVINQMEVALGILPGGSGTQRLPRLVGPGRAMEICLGSDDIDAETCERWGLVNRIFDSLEELNSFVDRLAARIASWPAQGVALCKSSINNAEMPIEKGLLEEAYLFQQTLRTEDARQNLRKALELGAQTRPGELGMTYLCDDVAAALREK